VTRPAAKAAAFCELLRAARLEPVCLPAIQPQPVEDTTALDDALANLAVYRWIVFTSGTAARIFGKRAQVLGVGLKGVRAGVVAGPATAEILARCGLPATTVLSPFSAQRALDALAAQVHPGDRALLPRPERGMVTLAQGLQACGAAVDEIVLYRTLPATDADTDAIAALANGEVAAVTFFSPSAVDGLDAALEAAGLPAEVVRRTKEQVLATCIGPTTEAAASGAGWCVVTTAPETTSEALVNMLATRLQQEVVAC
jgi:uroporphyrinogen III methyltransferase/synthase